MGYPTGLRRSILALALAATSTGCVTTATAPRREAMTGLTGNMTLAAAIVDAPDADAVESRVEAQIGRGGATDAAEPVELDASWKGFGFRGCSYIAPSRDFVSADGAFDIVFHFHAGQMSDRDIRASGLRAVFVSCGFGLGTSGYARAFADPDRLGRMMDRVAQALEGSVGRSVHVGRLGLVSWSAGYAAVSRILSVPRWYAMTDFVVLLDSLHTSYVGTKARMPLQGVEHVDVRSMEAFVRYAKDAVSGKKMMVVTHSDIVPPDYASTTEASEALLTTVGVPIDEANETTERGMHLRSRADAGNLHVRGFAGRNARDHFDHLHLIGEVLRSWMVPRWKRAEPLVYTSPGEQR